ncbi:hypothetical protein B0H15DRAFT_818114 [Mycena belliarum]|uniref:Uncharacterized protein n=1 Tax=Mycena belliarum TaxID=1033014 RepID=A0AAD6XU41_9AGAR|nr:hypothetical protein B0H15DRAFT_818114 [Mycena belliae]
MAILECRDALQVIKADMGNKYRPADTLAKTCTDYAHIVILSHRNKYYRNPKEAGTSIQSAILVAMRKLGVEGLPPAMETGRSAVVLKIIGKALTDTRYHIKQQIFASLASHAKGKPIDIAKLARMCISGSSAKATAAMYQRLGVLRGIASDYAKKGGSISGKQMSDDSADSFWISVDAQLALYYSEFSKEDRQGLWEMLYENDTKTHGNPDATISITEAKNLDDWLNTLNNAVA